MHQHTIHKGKISFSTCILLLTYEYTLEACDGNGDSYKGYNTAVRR